MRFPAFISELRRRRVFRVAAAYGVVAWLLIQVATSTFPYLHLPAWMVTAVIVLVLAGFPIALVLAWAFDITPDGVRRTEAVHATTREPAAPQPHARRYRRRPVYAAAAAVAVLAGAGAYAYRAGAAGAGAAPGVGIASIAVLPFADMSAGGDQAYLGDGLAEELLDALSKIDGLRVPSRTSSFSFRRSSVGIREVGRALDVEAVLQGSVRRDGKRVKVTAQLIDARTDRHLWSSSWDRELRDIFALQEEIARSIVAALGVRLAGRPALIRQHGGDLVAYDLYMRGRSQLLNRTREATLAAIAAFEAALERDPGYALAHAGLGLAAAEMHLRYPARGADEAWDERAMRAAHRALDLDPRLGEAHEALASVFRKTEFDWQRTIEESRRAIALSPSLDSPYHFMAVALYHLGLIDESERALDAAETLSPTGDKVELLRSRGMAALLAGRYPEAVRALEEAQRRSDQAIADWNLALATFYVGDVERAETMLRRLADSPSSSTAARGKATLASVLAARAQTAEARVLLGAIDADGYMDHHVAYSIGAAHAQLGEAAAAVRWLRDSAETGFPCAPWYARDPLLEPLRADANFQTLLEQLEAATARERERYEVPIAAR